MNKEIKTEDIIKDSKKVRIDFTSHALDVLREEAEGRSQGSTRLKALQEGFSILDTIDQSIINAITHSIRSKNLINLISHLNKNITTLSESDSEEKLKYIIRDISVLFSLSKAPSASLDVLNENLNAENIDYTTEDDIRSLNDWMLNKAEICVDDAEYNEQPKISK